jgi:hypothetical protein
VGYISLDTSKAHNEPLFVQFQFGILLELRMTSSKVIEANPYQKAITMMDTTWCVNVPVLSKTGKVEKTGQP